METRELCPSCHGSVEPEDFSCPSCGHEIYVATAEAIAALEYVKAKRAAVTAARLANEARAKADKMAEDAQKAASVAQEAEATASLLAQKANALKP